MPHSDVPAGLADYFSRTSIALALSSAAPDQPLLLVNEGFTALTGYTTEEAIGRNCRFLQGEADNGEARRRINAFLADPEVPNIRTTLINFRKDGTPFVNLLYMSKLRSREVSEGFIFASQFDVSRTQVGWLRDYNAELGRTLGDLVPILSDTGIIVSGTLDALANGAATIAEAKVTLAELEDDH